MNSDKPLETAAIFFSNEPLPKTVLTRSLSWLISLRALTRNVMNAGRELKMTNSCPQWDSNPEPSAYEANGLTIALLDLKSIEDLKVDRVLP